MGVEVDVFDLVEECLHGRCLGVDRHGAQRRVGREPQGRGVVEDGELPVGFQDSGLVDRDRTPLPVEIASGRRQRVDDPDAVGIPCDGGYCVRMRGGDADLLLGRPPVGFDRAAYGQGVAGVVGQPSGSIEAVARDGEAGDGELGVERLVRFYAQMLPVRLPAAADGDEVGVPASDVVRIGHFESQPPCFVGRQAGLPECVVVKIGAQRVRHTGLERESVAARRVPLGGFDEDDPVCGPRPVDCGVRVPDEVHRQDASPVEVRQCPVVGYAVHDDHRGLTGDCARSPHLYPGGHARERAGERFRLLVEFRECHFRCDRCGIGPASHHGPLSGLPVSYDHDFVQRVVIFLQDDVIVVAGDQFGGEIPVADITDDERSPSRVREGEFPGRIRDSPGVSPVDLHRCPGNGFSIRVAHGACDNFARQVGFADAPRVSQRVVPLRLRGLVVGQRCRGARYAQHPFQFPEQRAAAVVGRFLYERIHPQVVDAALSQPYRGRTAGRIPEDEVYPEVALRQPVDFGRRAVVEPAGGVFSRRLQEHHDRLCPCAVRQFAWGELQAAAVHERDRRDGRDQPRFVFDHVGEPPPEYAADRFGRKRVLPEADRLRERFELPLDRVLLPALLFQVVVPNVVTVAALDLETVDRKCIRIERTDLYAPGGESPVGERPGQDRCFVLRPVPAVAAGLLLRAVEVVADPAGVDNARQFGFNGVGGLPVRLSREQGRFPEGVVDRNHVPCQQRRLALREHAFLFPVVFPDGDPHGTVVPGGLPGSHCGLSAVYRNDGLQPLARIDVLDGHLPVVGAQPQRVQPRPYREAIRRQLLRLFEIVGLFVDPQDMDALHLPVDDHIGG